MATKVPQTSRDLTEEISQLILNNIGTSYRDLYLQKTLMSKYADPTPASLSTRVDKAFLKWKRQELLNSKTNIRLYALLDDTKIIAGVNIERMFVLARRIIKRLIGSSPPLDSLIGSFSGGASTSKRRRPGVIARKYSEIPDVTQEAWDIIWPFLYRDSELWLSLNPGILSPRFVEGNVMFTVPKNNEVERIACKEPDLNMYMQKAVGDFIRRRLRNVDIDLNDQTKNQRLAREGSISGDLCTIDLSSASDSISTQLVCKLLPTDWFTFLDGLRCKKTTLIDSSVHLNEMFSSMGNAFTFELESLIFYSLVKAVSILVRDNRVISIYGDDIICSSLLYGRLTRIFSYVGFRINTSKSFHTGRFRESCGKHYHAGVDVTPFFIRRPITSVHEIIRILNQLRGFLSRESSWCDHTWYDTWRSIAKYIPDRRLFGGYDLDSISTVCSRFGSGYRLVEDVRITAPASLQVGMYLEWQSRALKRSGLTADSSAVTFQTGRYKLIKPKSTFARNFGLSTPCFPQEWS